MRIYDPSSPLVSLHVPKAGGTSLLHLLEEWFPDGRLVRHYRDPSGLFPARHKFEGSICIHGHFNSASGFGVSEYYPQANQFMTFLREPFDRFVSVWFFLNRLKSDNIPVAVPDVSSDFETFLHQQAEDHEIRKSQFSFIHHFPEMTDIESVQKVLTERFVFVGIMEEYQKSLNRLCEVLRRPVSQLPHLNATPRLSCDYLKYRSFYEKRFSDEMEIYEVAFRINDVADHSGHFNPS